MSSSLAALKKQIRADIKSALARYTADRIASESALTSIRALASTQYKRCSALSIFLSMPREIQTSQIIASAIADGKRVFIPKVLGPQPRDMVMVEITSLEEIDSFPKSTWGIPEPVLGSEFVDGTYLGVIDCVLVPGVAFDRRCARLGHGRGYYDSFLEALQAVNSEKGSVRPVTLGLALSCQVLDEDLPMEPHDRFLDVVFTSDCEYTLSEDATVS